MIADTHTRTHVVHTIKFYGSKMYRVRRLSGHNIYLLLNTAEGYSI